MTKTEAINILELYNPFLGGDDYKLLSEAMDIAVKALKSQPEQSSEIQDILDYLDTVLHPIVSPEHWNVYSELHDMILMLPSAQPDHTADISKMVEECFGADEEELDAIATTIIELPSAQPEICEGCKHLGKWENEVEYGYPSPCTRCKRRVGDHYEN